MMEHILLGIAFLGWVAFEVRHRVLQTRRSQSLAAPIAREQELRRCGL